MERYEREDGVVVYRVSSSLYPRDSISINVDNAYGVEKPTFFIRARENSQQVLLGFSDEDMEEFFMAWAVLRGGNR